VGKGVEGAAVGSDTTVGVGASAMTVQADTPSKSSPTRKVWLKNNLDLFIINI
jgi:hypothetical protein